MKFKPLCRSLAKVKLCIIFEFFLSNYKFNILGTKKQKILKKWKSILMILHSQGIKFKLMALTTPKP